LVVDRGDDGDHIGAAYEDLEHWSADAMQPFADFVAGVNVAIDSTLDGPGALAITAPLLRQALLSAGVWLEAHPCPDEVLRDCVRQLVEQFADTLITLGLDPRRDWARVRPVLDEQLSLLAGGFTEFLADCTLNSADPGHGSRRCRLLQGDSRLTPSKPLTCFSHDHSRSLFMPMTARPVHRTGSGQSVGVPTR
jgi:hypothetical protein